MVQNDDEVFNSKPMLKIYTHHIKPTIAFTFNWSGTFSVPMKRSVRPLFSILLLIVTAATLCCRFALRGGSFGSIYVDGSIRSSKDHSMNSETSNPITDFPLFNSTLLKLAEIEPGEEQMKRQITQLLEGNIGNLVRYRTYALWRRYGIIATRPGGILGSSRSPKLYKIYLRFKSVLSDWARKKRFESDIMSELVNQVKVPIDKYNGVVVGTNDIKKFSSCAVVGNSGILLSSEYGDMIDSHEAVIRLNNARIENFQRNVGSKTTVSFINSNILHLCARREGCLCHPYGSNVPIAMYICQPVHFLDYTFCNSSHKSPLIITDPRFDVLCSRIINYYSLKRYAEEGPANKTLEQWKSSHDGILFHYSSGMQAVMLALGICDQVSMFGFGKSTAAKHHYHTNQKAELGLHDYQAEYDLYRDLVERPWTVPFISSKFKLPPLVIHH